MSKSANSIQNAQDNNFHQINHVQPNMKKNSGNLVNPLLRQSAQSDRFSESSVKINERIRNVSEEYERLVEKERQMRQGYNLN